MLLVGGVRDHPAEGATVDPPQAGRRPRVLVASAPHRGRTRAVVQKGKLSEGPVGCALAPVSHLDAVFYNLELQVQSERETGRVNLAT